MSNEVISTRVRLARNLKDYPFPCRLSEQGRKKVIEKVTSAIRDSNSSIASDFNLIKLDDLTEAQGVSLVERHLVSPEFISETEGRALLLSKDESMSIMINEEDHIRLQVITDGLSLEQAYDTADKLDTLLDENLEFAFDDKLGYLTQCPTNLGTGMRASVMPARFAQLQVHCHRSSCVRFLLKCKDLTDSVNVHSSGCERSIA